MRIIFFSFFYKTTRLLVTSLIYLTQRLTFQKKDLEPAIKFGDFCLTALIPLKRFTYNFEIPNNIQVEIFNLKFRSPLIGSSFKSNEKIISIWLDMGLGSAIFKTIMKNERLGNKRPRIQDTYYNNEKGIVNALGLPGSGTHKFSKSLNDSILWNYDCPIGISIGGDSSSEYVENIKTLETNQFLKEKQYFYELNISCPNTTDGCTLNDSPDNFDSVLKEINKIINVPISVKISPDSSNDIIRKIAEICSFHDQVIINAGNSQYKSKSELNIPSNSLTTIGGGLSGTSLFNRTLEVVKILAPFNIPIIATGGINNFDQIEILKKEGAALFGMATALIFNPYCIPKINSNLKNV